jgi:hypothetical protein
MQVLKKDDPIPAGKTDPDKVKPDDILAIIQFVKVEQVHAQGAQLRVRRLDENRSTFDIRGKDLVVTLLSADQYQHEVQITKTRAAELLISAYNQPFTVIFQKENGELRTLRGRLVHAEPLLGRSKCEDLDLPLTEKGGRLRLVDHRTIQTLILGGTKFNVRS